MNYDRIPIEEQRELLKGELANLQRQHWARSRDKRKIEAQPETPRAASIHSGITESAQASRKQQLAQIEYDLENLEVAIAVTEAEMDALPNA